MIRKLFALALSSSFVLALAISEADGGGRRRAPRSFAPGMSGSAPTRTYSTAAPVASSTRDPGSFVAWINGVRARSGLRPVAWSDALASDAAQNSARGFGHSYLGRARRQNAGMGSLGAVEGAWLASPAHASALLDPSITLVGLAGVGNVWTYSAR